MALLDYTMSAYGNSATELSWSGTGWVYVNGSYICGPESDGCLVPYEFTITSAIEVHDVQVDATINEVPANRPLIRWRIALGSEADEYRVYHTPKGGTRELIVTFPDNGTDDFYITQAPENLVDGWHLFEVTSAQNSTETTVDAWPYRVYALPDCASDISAEDGSGSGLFDITVTPGV